MSDERSGHPETDVVVFGAADALEAYAVHAALAEAGVDATVIETAARAPHLVSKHARDDDHVLVRVSGRDLESARAIIAECCSSGAFESSESTESSESSTTQLDWESIDVGVREDDLPLTAPGRMPAPARVAFMVAIGVAILGGIGAVVIVFN